MRIPTAWLAVAFCSICATPLSAGTCFVDPVPAATLLLPYFEVNPNPARLTTLFEINNAGPAPVLTKVTVWSDLSVPVFSFNVSLLGFDVVPINMRDVLNLHLPQTGPGGFPNCEDALPPPPEPPVPGVDLTVADIRNALTGQAVETSGGLCFGVSHGDSTPRGYVTIDVVGRCTRLIPGDPGYFVPGGEGEARNDNVLWGNFLLVDPSNNFAQGDTLVAIEANALDPETGAPGEYTFYGRFVGWNADDNREPLSSVLATRYLLNPAFTGGTELIVWRDPKTPVGLFDCSVGPPPPFPLGQEGVVALDETADSFMLSPADRPFPWVAQRVQVGSPALPTPYDAGWMFLDLDVGDINGNPPSNPAASQNWVGAIESAEGRFSVGLEAFQIESTCP